MAQLLGVCAYPMYSQLQYSNVFVTFPLTLICFGIFLSYHIFGWSCRIFVHYQLHIPLVS